MNTGTETNEEILVVHCGNRLTAMTSKEYHENDVELITLGNLKEAFSKLTIAEARLVRDEVIGLISMCEIQPTSQISEFLKAVELLDSAPKSPLPPVDETIKNPFTTKKPLVTCLVDADGTVLKPRRKHSIALEDFNQFILDRYPDFGGNIEARKNLAKLFLRYRKQEDDKLTIEGRGTIDTDLNYEQLIDDSGDFYARSMEGVSIHKAFQVGEEFVKISKIERLFYDYAIEAIEKNKQYGVYTTIVTGLPEQLAKPLTKKLGAQFYIAMKLEIRLDEQNPTITIPASKDDEGAFEQGGQWFRKAQNLICTGNLERNTGNKNGKNEAVGFMVAPDAKKPTGQHPPHSIVYGWGNSSSDLPLADASRDSHHPYDLHGFGMLINPEKETWKLTEDAHFRPKRTGKLRVFGEGTEKIKFLEELEDKLNRSFDNPRNAKKIAQILTAHGYSRKHIIARFKRHYKDNPELAMETAADLRIFGQEAEFLVTCESLGVGGQAKEIIEALREQFQSILPSEPNKTTSISSFPRKRVSEPVTKVDEDNAEKSDYNESSNV